MKHRKTTLYLFCVIVLVTLISCQFFSQISGDTLPVESTTGAQPGETESEAEATIAPATEVPTMPPSDTPAPTETNPPSRTPTKEPTPTEAPASGFGDQRMSIVLDDTRRMQELPEDFEQPPADAGNEYLVFYLTVTRIEDVFITDMLGDREDPPKLVVDTDTEYPATYARVTGIKFLDPTNLTGPSKLVEGSEGFYAFEAPEGSQPKRLILPYEYKQEIEDQDSQSAEIEIDLTESVPSSEMACQVDDGQQDTLRIQVPLTSKPVTIDGEKSPDEWDQAFCMDVRMYEWGDRQNGEMQQARWLLQYDQEFVYLLVRVSKQSDLRGTAMAYFWPKYTGTWAHSDGFFVDTNGKFQDHSNWDESNWHKDETLSPPGSIDVNAAVSEDDEFYWFEIQKALDSGDGYDWVLEPGSVVGSNPDDTVLFVLTMENSEYYRNIQIKLEDR